VLAEPVILFVAKPEYHDAIQYVAPITLAFWLSVAARPFTWNLNYSKKTGQLSAIRSIPVGVLLVLLFFFLDYMDLRIWGVINAMIISSIFTIVLGFSVSQMHYRISYPFARILAITVMLLACGIAIYSLPQGAGLDVFVIKLLILSAFVLCAVKVAGIGSLIQLFIPRRPAAK
jgi:O-antigen/teichoic acid export membrane protein